MAPKRYTMVLSTLAMVLSATVAQTAPPSMFPFVIPWDDATPTRVDVSFLNREPAGSGGFIVRRGSHFIRSNTGERVRFLAVNFTTSMAFPTREDADRVAARLAKYGVNLVRFHHLQATWDPEGMIWRRGREYIELDPAQLDRLDYLIYALKRHGIYSNMNLSTTRWYQPESGFPESVLDIPFGFHKRVDRFNRRMIELQKEYFDGVLNRVNPYTRLHYKDDPAMAFVELNNENSMLGHPWEAFAQGYRELPEPFLGDLRRLWNDWLAIKYPTTAYVERSWMRGVTPNAPSIVTQTNAWAHENHQNHDIVITDLPRGENFRTARGVTVNLRTAPGTDWFAQSTLPGLNLVNNQTYTLRFQARADRERGARVAVTQDRGEYANVGLNRTFRLTTQDQTFEYTFAVQNAIENHSRVAFSLGGEVGAVTITDLSLSPGLAGPIIPSGQSLEARNIEDPEGGTHHQMSDWVIFLTETETRYANEMLDHIRGRGFRSLVIDTQAPWGGLTSMEREARMDFTDNHQYWQAPLFPGQPWDPVNWIVPRRSLVQAMAQGDFGTLGDMALFRRYDRPYVVSEYNHPAPNDFQTEMMPLVSAFHAFQDWDGMHAFDYGHTYTGGQANDQIQGWFAVGTNPSKWAFFPSSALIIRQELIPPATAAVVMQVGPRAWQHTWNAYAAWRSVGGTPSPLRYRIGKEISPNLSGFDVRRYGTMSTPLRMDGEVFVADAPKAAVVTGMVGTRTINVAGGSMTFNVPGEGFAALTLVPMDNQELRTSGRMLLTVMGRAENVGMGWNADRTSVGNQWGQGPVHVEGTNLTVEMAAASGLRVWALDTTGARAQEVPTRIVNGRLRFEVGPQFRTVWYEIGR